MTDPILRPSGAMSRRVFCRSALATAVAAPLAGLGAGAAQGANGIKFFKNLAPGHIGVKANQQQALEYAVKYGFGGISPSDGEFAKKSAAEIGAWVALMKQKGIRYGAAGLPVEAPAAAADAVPAPPREPRPAREKERPVIVQPLQPRPVTQE